MTSVCVFLGASAGTHPGVRQAAIAMGEAIARRNITLVYGGSDVGLMSVLARTVKQQGGRVVGIMPQWLMAVEKPLDDPDEFVVVKDMAERKQLMLQRADAFITLPGGLGTLEELFETWSAMRLGLLGDKPLGFLNVEGYFDQLFAFMATSEAFGFVSAEHRVLPKVEVTADALLDRLFGVV